MSKESFRIFKRKNNKTPVILQMEANECGAASLAIILAYYKKYVPLEILREKCDINRNGSKASNIIKAARNCGCNAAGFKKDIDALKSIDKPVIAFWNFQHFIVIESFSKKWVYINDPAEGRRKIEYEELDKSYSGVCLIIEPNENFIADGKPPSIFKGLIGRLKPSKRLLTCSFIISLFIVIPGLIIPHILRVFADSVLSQSNGRLLAVLITGLILTLIIKFILTYLQQNYLLKLEKELTINNSSSFFWHLLHLPITFFYQRFTGEISSRIKLNEQVSVLLSREAATNLLNACMLIFFAAAMFYYDAALTFTSIGIVFINLIALHYVSRKRRNANRKLLQERGKLIGISMGGIRMMDTYKSTGAEDDFFQQWSGYQARVLNVQQELEYSTHILSVLPNFLSAINISIVLLFGGGRIISGSLTVGQLIAFYSLLLQFSEPVTRLVNMGSMMQIIDANLAKLDDVLNYPADLPKQTDSSRSETCRCSSDKLSPAQSLPSSDRDLSAQSLPSSNRSKQTEGDIQILLKQNKVKLTGAVELKNVTFGYSRLEPPLIDNLCIKIMPGQRIAIVGATGCGKSTIAKLVSGLYKPWSGEILFDDVPINEIPDILKLNSIAMVDQDIFLFEGTIRDNLTLWDKTAPEENILQAAKDALIHQDVASRQTGYDAIISEGGRNFSGGQRQRLEIARSLVNNPSILILDEATASLDSVTEKKIDDNIRKRGCSCFIIAHRLSSIRDSDEIILLDRGKITERGKHGDLVKLKGKYFELIKE